MPSTDQAIARTTPVNWQEHRPVHREDGELVGVIVGDSELWSPCTVFGTALAAPRPHDQAVDYLHAHGLSALADPWELLHEGAWINVSIVEADPNRVTVQFADYGRADLFGQRHTLAAPAGENLRRR
ncbi:hypothetical protein ON058_04655 [Demequina sp. B12]|uniref:hypothetical protein n=1 Tax=Demequina sp. B12 TaxID=2992757 RepID=UPI00237A2CBD|nr:hypothetical protein [Demequina sp. B12]MDE0572704.1 hypothetical protein [Demequina sp. B12]